MRGFIKFGLLGLLCLSWANAWGATAGFSAIEEAERLDWSDPEAAIKALDAAPSATDVPAASSEALEVRGMLGVDNARDADVAAIVRQLQARVAQGDPSATVAGYFVRAYSLTAHDRFDAARSLLNLIDWNLIRSASEHYRVLMLQGTVARRLGEHEAAARFYEQALDAANTLHDDSRALQAILYLTRVFMNAGNSERAVAELRLAKKLASQLGYEVAWVDIERKQSELADLRGDAAAAMRASQAALAHAERAGSNKWLAAALVDISSSYLSTGDFARSLAYSKKALLLAQKVHSKIWEQTSLCNEGIAYIRLGNIPLGKKLAEGAIAVEVADEDLFNAADLLQDYAQTLEYVHDWRGAIAAYHRYDDIRDKLMTAARQRAVLELTAQFDDERKVHELELLRRDNALRIANEHAQRLREQPILIGAACVACLCAILAWSFTRVRKANQRLRFTSEHDALTGLPNRRFFNERVFGSEGTRPVSGCIILADLDHFKRINDTYGHPAGDAVLSAISRRLSAALRHDDTLVRWGGEEFLAVLSSMTEREAEATTRRILQTVRGESITWRGQSIHCTISVGYAIFPMAGAAIDVSFDSAISAVDKALYAAKRRGRDRACRIKLMSAITAQAASAGSAECETTTSEHRLHVVETLDEAA